MKNVIVASKEGRYFGWPANKGAWAWGDELLVGFVDGTYAPGGIHNCHRPFIDSFARSMDGGITWKVEVPEVNCGDKPNGPLPDNIDFNDPDLALRFTGSFDHSKGTADEGAVFISYSRGKKWAGPFSMKSAGLAKAGIHSTMRTNYIKELGMIFGSSGFNNSWGDDYAVCINRNLERHSVICADTSRAVMPAAAFVDGGITVLLRRRNNLREQCWIESFRLESLAEQVWISQGHVTDTGGTPRNGNPPALIYHEEAGMLIMAYGNRDQRTMNYRTSYDAGKNWSQPVIIRDDFYDELSGYGDLGYPQLFKSSQGIVCVYYWATKENPHQHIAASILHRNRHD